MKRTIPYLVLGALGVLGLFLGQSADTALALTPTPSVAEAQTVEVGDGAVRVVVGLEREKLLAGRAGETFLRVGLEGLERPGPKERAPVSLTLVIDRSGSMSGRKMDDAEEAAVRALEALLPGDRASVVSFDDGAEVLARGLVIGRDSLEPARRAIRALFARSGTDMVAGLRVGGDAARAIASPERTNRLLLLSDGRPNIEHGLEDLVRSLRRDGIQTTTLGLGEDYNEDLMARLADAGLGHYYFVEKSDALAGILAEELSALSQVVAREAVITLEPKSGAQIAEVIGFEHYDQGAHVTIPVGDVFSRRTTDVLVRLVHPALEGEKALVRAQVTWQEALAEGPRGDERVLAAAFVHDRSAVEASVVKHVAEKAEKHRTARALTLANEAFNRGDVAAGNAILDRQKLRLQTSAAALGSAHLAQEQAELERYQAQNLSGASTRKSMNMQFKWKARQLRRGY